LKIMGGTLQVTCWGVKVTGAYGAGANAQDLPETAGFKDCGQAASGRCTRHFLGAAQEAQGRNAPAIFSGS
jgi:hypothetical protein